MFICSAFNNVFSNIGYVMLGFLYLLIVWRKHHLHKKAVAADYHHAKVPVIQLLFIKGING